MLNPNLIAAFKYHRSYTGRTSASRALELSRLDVQANRTRYPATRGAMRGGADWQIGRDNVFWCERPDDYLRRVGFVDEIPNESSYRGKFVDHKGWYLEDNYSSEVARGLVFQLPAHKGKPRFISGIADPNNDGPAILSLEIFNDKGEAARNADHLAEHYAETERDYQRANRAGFEYRELGEEIAATRVETLELFAERRELKALVGDKFKAACRALNQTIKANWREIKRARDKRETLFDAYGHVDAFND
ncbi:MAG: hypothetical protein ACXWNL_16150 [Vulcanimicrobiaceae bacterium]